MAGVKQPPVDIDSLMLLYVLQLRLISERLSVLLIKNIGLVNDYLEGVQDVYERVDRRKIYLNWCHQFPNIRRHPDLLEFVKTLYKQNEEDYKEISRRINEHVERTLRTTQRLKELRDRRRKLMCRK